MRIVLREFIRRAFARVPLGQHANNLTRTEDMNAFVRDKENVLRICMLIHSALDITVYLYQISGVKPPVCRGYEGRKGKTLGGIFVLYREEQESRFSVLYEEGNMPKLAKTCQCCCCNKTVPQTELYVLPCSHTYHKSCLARKASGAPHRAGGERHEISCSQDICTRKIDIERLVRDGVMLAPRDMCKGCGQQILNKKDILVVSPCGDTFHTTCLTKLTRSSPTCPGCGKPLSATMIRTLSSQHPPPVVVCKFCGHSAIKDNFVASCCGAVVHERCIRDAIKIKGIAGARCPACGKLFPESDYKRLLPAKRVCVVCAVCGKSSIEGEIHTLRCDHHYHRDCIVHELQHCEKQGHADLKCKVCRNVVEQSDLDKLSMTLSLCRKCEKWIVNSKSERRFQCGHAYHATCCYAKVLPGVGLKESCLLCSAKPKPRPKSRLSSTKKV